MVDVGLGAVGRYMVDVGHRAEGRCFPSNNGGCRSSA